MINFNYRNIPAIRLLKKLIHGGKLGNIFLYRYTMGGNRLSNESIPFEWRMDAKMSGMGAMEDFVVIHGEQGGDNRKSN